MNRLSEIQQCSMDEVQKELLVEDTLEQIESLGLQEVRKGKQFTLLHLVEFYLNDYRHAKAYQLLKKLDKGTCLLLLEKMGGHYLVGGAYERAVLFFRYAKEFQSGIKTQYIKKKKHRIKPYQDTKRINQAEKLIKLGNDKIGKAQKIRQEITIKGSDSSNLNPLIRSIKKVNMLERVGQEILQRGFYIKEKQKGIFEKGLIYWVERVNSIRTKLSNSNKTLNFLENEIGDEEKRGKRASWFLQRAQQEKNHRTFPYRKEHFLMVAEEAGSKEAYYELLKQSLQGRCADRAWNLLSE